MKRTKIILSTIILLAIVGGAFAFKATRYNGNRAWKYTYTITIPGNVCSSTRAFCTSINNTVFFTTEWPITTTLSSTVGPPSTITLICTNGTTITIPFTVCTLIETGTTAIN